MSAPTINRMQFHDRWYPGDPDALHRVLSAGTAAHRAAVPAAGAPLHDVRLAVLPHAGLAYSARGQMAFWDTVDPGELRAAVDRIVLVAPSHYVPIPGDTTVGGRFSGHETPFGTLPDGGTVADEDDRGTVEREHAVELLLPAIAATLGTEIPVSPVLVGAFSGPDAAADAARRIVRRLAEQGVARGRVLWLGSSDATHYGRRFGWTPLGQGRWSELADRLRSADTSLVSAAVSGDRARYWSDLARGTTVCGRFALAMAIEAQLRFLGSGTGPHGGRVAGRILDYYASPDVTGSDEAEFVCYVTAVMEEATV